MAMLKQIHLLMTVKLWVPLYMYFRDNIFGVVDLGLLNWYYFYFNQLRTTNEDDVLGNIASHTFYLK